MEDSVEADRASILSVFMETDLEGAQHRPDAECMESFLESLAALEVTWAANERLKPNPGRARAYALPLHERQKV